VSTFNLAKNPVSWVTTAV